jgi:hypothetical protein
MSPNENAIAPECGPTLERVQAVLDRIHPASILDADLHPATCPACRQRVRAALLVHSAFAKPEQVSVPAELTGAILAGVRRDRISRARQRGLLYAGSFAAAAAILLAIWFNQPRQNDADLVMRDPKPEPKLPTPAPQPIRLNDELARAGEALRESSRTITEPAASAPRMMAAITDSLLKAPAAPIPMNLGPASKSLSDIPEAARVGLEPVTGTAQKAFHRLIRDVSAIQPKMKS